MNSHASCTIPVEPTNPTLALLIASLDILSLVNNSVGNNTSHIRNIL